MSYEFFFGCLIGFIFMELYFHLIRTTERKSEELRAQIRAEVINELKQEGAKKK